ncbi:BrnT family toxin [candidate division NPL-UPA2 bacterium]|nr:BrnT family toxin [candidate division NPL-UPA2 bacterium]
MTFPEAATVFADAFSTTFPDPDHSVSEERYITVGMSEIGKILIISHTDRRDRIRLISARKATRRERKYYEERK